MTIFLVCRLAGCQSLMFEIHWAVGIMYGYQHNRSTTKHVEMLLYSNMDQ